MCPSLAVAFVTFGHWCRRPYHYVGAIIKHGRADGAGTVAITIKDGPVDQTGAEGKIAQFIYVI